MMLDKSFTEHGVVKTVSETQQCSLSGETIYNGDLVVTLNKSNIGPEIVLSRPSCHNLATDLRTLSEFKGAKINKPHLVLSRCQTEIKGCEVCGELLETGDTAAVFTSLHSSKSVWTHIDTCTEDLADTLEQIDEYIPQITAERL
jgi:hypothetical protein